MLIICGVCLLLFCERDFSGIQNQLESPLEPEITLKAEKVRVKEAWIELKLTNISGDNNYQLYRDSIFNL